jgi:adenosylcobinamide-GDP ribazoletransferase
MSGTPPFQSGPEPVPQPSWRSGRASWLLVQWKEFVAAVRFLSILPIPGAAQLFRTTIAEDDAKVFLGSAYFPLVGLLQAVILWLVVLIFGSYVSGLVLAALLVVALVILTGGLHLDGLMDCCDGLFGGRGRERQLEIMRDSRVGSFGVLGGICVLLLKFSLLASLNTYQLPLALLTILPLARLNMVWAMYAFPGARPSGLGAFFRQTVTRRRVICASILALIIAVLAGHIVVGLILFVCGALITWIIGEYATSVLGGLTGDVYGAITEISEIVLLLLFTLLRLWLKQ